MLSPRATRRSYQKGVYVRRVCVEHCTQGKSRCTLFSMLELIYLTFYLSFARNATQKLSVSGRHGYKVYGEYLSSLRGAHEASTTVKTYDMPLGLCFSSDAGYQQTPTIALRLARIVQVVWSQAGVLIANAYRSSGERARELHRKHHIVPVLHRQLCRLIRRFQRMGYSGSRV